MKSLLCVDGLDVGWRGDAHSLGYMYEIAFVEEPWAMLVCKRQSLLSCTITQSLVSSQGRELRRPNDDMQLELDKRNSIADRSLHQSLFSYRKVYSELGYLKNHNTLTIDMLAACHSPVRGKIR